MKAWLAAEGFDESSCAPTAHAIRIPRAADARLLLHGLDADSPFMETLHEVLPDEEACLAYLNHLAWQTRS